MLKLGCVSYMNALPLTYSLDPQEVELMSRPPAQLLDLLKNGQVEAALLPIVNYFENPDLFLVPDLAIACRGAVKSVRLYFMEGRGEVSSPKGWETQPLQNIRIIYLDPESRTSHALLKVILHHKYGVDLKSLTFTSDLSHPDIQVKLLIGDKTFQEKGPFLDLGEEWFTWQNKPFVFAAWMTFSNSNQKLAQILQKSRKESLSKLDEMIQHNPHFNSDILREYFTKNIHYTMESAELDGIRRFYELLKPIQGYKHELNFKFIS